MFDSKPVAVPLILTAALVLLISGNAIAQASITPVQATKGSEVTSGPSWAELTPPQKTALAPLATTWAGINEAQKRKWLEVAKNYSRLSPVEQTTMHSRMNEWVTMSPQQRAQARLNFAKTKELSTELTPDEKKAKWETYQALSPEEKKGLAAAAVPKPAGAATAVKPVAPQKLVLAPKAPASAAATAVAPPAAAGIPAAPAIPAVIKP